jgi:hypothetical protein
LGGGRQSTYRISYPLFGDREIELRLEVQPELRLDVEPVSESERGIASHRTLARDDLAGAIGRHIYLAGEFGLRNSEFRKLVS